MAQLNRAKFKHGGLTHQRDWTQSRVSDTRRYHEIKGNPMYEKRFDEVHSFHEPGLAPARVGESWFHILPDGSRAYGWEFNRVFGFYDGLAAVFQDGESYHILPNGCNAYEIRFLWCGNFQESLCAVKEKNGRYRHILRSGQSAYPESYTYVGDFREGAAVVQGDDGLHLHINREGKPINGQLFLDLGPFHKGKATARDEKGWFHIDREGSPIYNLRFSTIEPYYNGISRVGLSNGNILTIDEHGGALSVLVEPGNDLLMRISHDMVGYWKTWLLASSIELGIIQSLPCDLDCMAAELHIEKERIELLLRALQERGYVKCQEDGTWTSEPLTNLLAAYPSSGVSAMKDHWSKQMLPLWIRLAESIRAGIPGTELAYGTNLFDWLYADPERARTYQQALEMYAIHDYEDITKVIDFTRHKVILDAGGGTGSLLRRILNECPDAIGYVLEVEGAANLANSSIARSDRYNVVVSNIFDSWPMTGDAIILAKVLHDWDNEHALQILRRSHDALRDGGRVYIIDRVLKDDDPTGSLLALHLFLANGGKERSLKEFSVLCKSAGLDIVKVHQLKCGIGVIEGKAK